MVTLDVGQLLQRNLLAGGGCDRDVADLFRIVAILLLQPHHQVELLFLLHHLGGDIAADRGLDQLVHVIDIQAIAGDAIPLDRDREAGLTQFLHQGHIADAAHIFQHPLDVFALLLKDIEVRPEHFHRQSAFQPGLGFIHGVFGRLGVIEDDAGKGLELLVDGFDQGRLVAIPARPIRCKA